MYFNDIEDGFTTQQILCSSSHRIMSDKKIVYKEYNLFPGKEGEKWPNKTKLLCWYCSHKFKGCPRALPVEYKNSTWYVKGVFCSFSCAKSHLVRNENGDHHKLMLLNSFARLCFKYTEPITMSPPFHSLKSFGGTMTISEFRKHGDEGESIELLEGIFKPCDIAIKIQTNDIVENTGFRVGQVMGLRRNAVSKTSETKRITAKKKNKFDDFVKMKSS